MSRVTQKEIINRVLRMSNYDSEAKRLSKKHGLDVMNVTWDDCARNKGSVWGPCISDMTLQVDISRMPVIRQPNYTDKTWDVKIDKIPVIVGNEKKGNTKSNLRSITLKAYLKNFDKYTTCNIKESIDLFREKKDSHVIMSSQCCFLPIEKSKETKFNVALYNYQSTKENPAVLAIVSTSKGTSAQIIEDGSQKLLFNNFGKKADFMGQRLTDNRIERGVSVQGEMTKEEKQDNVVVIIQVPLKKRARAQPMQDDLFGDFFGGGGSYDYSYAVPQKQSVALTSCDLMSFNAMPTSLTMKKNKKKKRDKRRSEKESANVEAAIVKVAEKTVPMCICGADLVKKRASSAYYDSDGIGCDKCEKNVSGNVWIYHCPKKKIHKHRHGYDLCLTCAEEQLGFNELNGLEKIERDERYPIRVTLQYYKSTDNGVVNAAIIGAIANMLETSKAQADFVGSLVTESNPERPTEWVDFKSAEGEDEYGNISAILKKLNMFDTYIAAIKENEVTDEVLKVLEGADDLKDVVPKLGPRIKLWKAIGQWKKKQNNVDFIESIAF